MEITDTRIAEAERTLDRLEREGIPTAIAAELLRALVSSALSIEQAAERWLRDNARVGVGDLSEEAQRERREVQLAARRWMNSHISRHPQLVPAVEGLRERFSPTEAEFGQRLDDASFGISQYPHGFDNHQRLAKSDAEAKMQRKHGHLGTVTVEDDGDVFLTDSRTFKQRKVDHVDLPQRRVSEILANLRPDRTSEFSTSRRKPSRGHTDLDLSTSEPDEPSPYGEGVNRPFFED